MISCPSSFSSSFACHQPIVSVKITTDYFSIRSISNKNLLQYVMYECDEKKINTTLNNAWYHLKRDPQGLMRIEICNRCEMVVGDEK